MVIFSDSDNQLNTVAFCGDLPNGNILISCGFCGEEIEVPGALHEHRDISCPECTKDIIVGKFGDW